VEQRLVNGAELFDAEIAIRDLVASGAVGRLPGAERNERASCGLVVQIAALRERCPRRREQPPVERRHVEIAGPATSMRQARDCAKRVPQPSSIRTLCERAEGFDAVAVAVHRMPERYEPA